MRSRRDDTGAITALFAALLPALVVLVGLAVDFTGLVVGSNRADDEAEAAAAAGADAVSEDAIRRGLVEPDPAVAVRLAEEFVRTEFGHDARARVVSSGRCEVGRPPPCTAVEVTVAIDQPLRFLTAAAASITVHGRGRAIPQPGVHRGD